jgi:hypothetical protein
LAVGDGPVSLFETAAVDALAGLWARATFGVRSDLTMRAGFRARARARGFAGAVLLTPDGFFGRMKSSFERETNHELQQSGCLVEVPVEGCNYPATCGLGSPGGFNDERVQD